MKLKGLIRKAFYNFGLEEQEYKQIQNRIVEDNRVRLFSASLIMSAFLMVMLALSFVVEDIGHTRNIYLFTAVLTIAQLVFTQIGKKRKVLVSIGVYLFTIVVFTFGMYQGIVTAPAEQTASFMVLMVAVPVWFTMKPANMVNFIYVNALFYVGCVLYAKSGYVQTADIVNTMVYATSSALISTYYTVIKAKRFYAEYCTEHMSKTDMLTGLGNRHAYTEAVGKYENKRLPDNLTVLFLDVNELKHINDTLGHHAGDELLCGAAACIRTVFSEVGGCYRTGGDEFIVMGEFSEETRRELCEQFERLTVDWQGSWEQNLRVSYGGASAREVSDGDLTQITKLADSRLYEAKALYYSTKGIDRREHQKAYRAMCESYIRILRVNLTDDLCRVIHTEPGDKLVQTGESGCFSRWMAKLLEIGNVHPDDMEEFRKKMDVAHLREYFHSGKNTIHIFYRRRVGDGFFAVMAEFAVAQEYSEDEQVVYLYVKNIDRMN